MGVGYGKLLLFGEHAVVHGHPAVGTGTNLHTRITFDSDFSGSGASERPIVVVGKRIATQGLDPDDIPLFVEALESARTHDQRALREPRALRVKSNVPRGVGLGSSSALCAALASELLGATPGSAHDQNISYATGNEVWRLAHHLEHVYHGTPSGVDTCLSTFAGLRAVYPQPGGDMPQTELLAAEEGSRSPGDRNARHPADPASDTNARAGLTVVYGYLPRSGDTRALVGKIRGALEDGSRDVHHRLEELGRSSRDAIEVLRARQPDAGALGALANEAQRHLEALGLSNEALRAVIAAGTKAGARGGKLSGAGGGGAWFLVFETPQQAESGREAVIATVGEIPAFTLPIGR